MSDAYAWTVQYRDGRIAAQINDDGEDVGSWESISHEHVSIIHLTPLIDGLPMHGLVVPEGATAFVTFRRTQELDPNTETQVTLPAIVVVGWESPESSSYLFVDILGNTLSANTRDAL